MPTNHSTLTAILWRSMACFFHCFGAGDAERHHLVSSSNSALSPAVEPVVSRNQKLSSLFQSEESEEPVVRERENHVRLAARTEPNDWELEDEAKFLKACGTIQGTPDEIRKSSKKLKDSAEHEAEVLKFHSWLPHMSTSIFLEKDKLSGQPSTPVRVNEEREMESAAMDSPTRSCTLREQSDVRTSISSPEDEAEDSSINMANIQIHGNLDAKDMSNSPGPAACKSVFRDRSVRFESQSVLSERSPQTCIRYSEKPVLKGDGILLNYSPYPTPQNLTEDMQTPGTVFASGNNARVRSQYVYAAMNKSEITDHSSISKGVPLGATDCNSEMSLEGGSIQRDVTVVTNSSAWLKSPVSYGAGKENKYISGRDQGKTPILGLVAEDWKEDDVSRISPKEWDGNGIQNSTRKYKEDQKLPWHATPFEERLEKALSEESFISQRKPVITEPVVFEDDKEIDTGACKLQSLKPSPPLLSS